MEFDVSRKICEPLVELALERRHDYPYECLEAQLSAKLAVKQLRCEMAIQSEGELKGELSATSKRAMELASEKGASNWLTSLPIEEFGFCLHKGAFRDALALRYGWPPSNVPLHCECGSTFTVEHVLSCPRGGFPSSAIMRYGMLRRPF